MSTDTINPAHFTAEQVLEALEAAVKGKEGYIDSHAQIPHLACKYAIDDSPSCIVGTTLAILGVPVKVLNVMDCAGNPMFNADGYEVLQQNGITMDRIAFGMLSRAQARQDRSMPWGLALEGAREVYAGTHEPYDM